MEDDRSTATSRLDRIAGLAAAASRRFPPGTEPCLAYVRIRTLGRERDLFFGPRASLDDEPRVLDMRDAPLAKLLFEIDVGEDYEVEVDERSLEGTLIDRATIDMESGVVTRIEDDRASYRRSTHGFVREPATNRLDSVVASHPVPRVSFGLDVTLDATQRAAVESTTSRPMLVVGEAGAGKTTVALRRLAHLTSRARVEGTPFRGLYVAPTDGLARWVEAALERSRVSGIDVVAFDDLAIHHARRTFPKLARRVSRDAPAAVVRLKRHWALDEALARIVDARPSALDDEDRRGEAHREDLLHLFGDRALLEAMISNETGVARGDVDAVVERTRAQFRERAEDAFADVVDATRLETLDGRSLDAGTPEDLAGRVDVEDLPVAFELMRLRASRSGARLPPLDRYDAIVVDEAQELAPLELRFLRRLVSRNGAWIVAGDEAQRTEAGISFRGFESTMHELGADDAEVIRLETSYRCPKDVTAFARPLRDDARAVASAGSTTIAARALGAELHVVMAIAALVRAIRDRDSTATVVVVARDRTTAARIGTPLVDALDASIAIDGRFDFRRRVFVATIADVRGLEFDYVVLPDLDAATYSEDALARRALYLGATRACVALALAWVGRPSPLFEIRSAT